MKSNSLVKVKPLSRWFLFKPWWRRQKQWQGQQGKVVYSMRGSYSDMVFHVVAFGEATTVLFQEDQLELCEMN